MIHRASYRRFAPFAALLACTVFLAGLSASDQNGRSDPRSSLRNDPDYARLYHDGQAFLALPLEKQEAMRDLHQELAKLPRAEREALRDIMKRYADWLDALSSQERQKVLDTADSKQRLRFVTQLREKQWVARQPKSFRRYLDSLPASKPPAAVAAGGTLGVLLGPSAGPRPISALTLWVADSTDLRAQSIARLKQDQARANNEWIIAKRFWNELTDASPKGRQAMQVRPAHFGPEVETFVNEYLRPVLSVEELSRLDAAEGHWPQFPMTLIELADKHPPALPQALGPTSYFDLPTRIQGEVQKRFDKDPKKKAKSPDAFFNVKAKKGEIDKRLNAIPLPKATPAIRFACTVATYLHTFPGVKFPYEYWAASPPEMSPTMQAFLHEIGYFWNGLSSDEKSQLKAAQGKWPEYPLKVQQLADKYAISVPWLTLPEIPAKAGLWEYYRLKPRTKLDLQQGGPNFKRDEMLKLDESQKLAVPKDPPRLDPAPNIGKRFVP